MRARSTAVVAAAAALVTAGVLAWVSRRSPASDRPTAPPRADGDGARGHGEPHGHGPGDYKPPSVRKGSNALANVTVDPRTAPPTSTELASIRGVVRQHKRGVAAALVLHGAVDYHTESTEDGNYQLHGVPAGDYELTINARDPQARALVLVGPPTTSRVHLEPGADLLADFTVDSAVTVALHLADAGVTDPRYYLASGHRTLKRELDAIAVQVASGHDADAKPDHAFPLVPPGVYTACAAGQRGATPVFGCATVTVGTSPDLVTVTIPVTTAP